MEFHFRFGDEGSRFQDYVREDNFIEVRERGVDLTEYRAVQVHRSMTVANQVDSVKEGVCCAFLHRMGR